MRNEMKAIEKLIGKRVIIRLTREAYGGEAIRELERTLPNE